MEAWRTSKRYTAAGEEYVVGLLLTAEEARRLLYDPDVSDPLSAENRTTLRRVLAEVDAHEREFNGNGTPKVHLRPIFSGRGGTALPETRPTEGLGQCGH